MQVNVCPHLSPATTSCSDLDAGRSTLRTGLGAIGVWRGGGEGGGGGVDF